MPSLFRLIWFWLALLVLSLVSILVLHSVAPLSATSQLWRLTAGIITIIVLSRIDYHLYLFSPWPWYFGALLLAVSTLLFGATIRGSVRWLMLGPISFQTSELIKPLLLLFFSIYLTQNRRLSLFALGQSLLYALVPASLVFLQPDLGTALIIMVIGLATIIASGTPLKHLSLLFLACLILLPPSYFFLAPYQRNRLLSFINPNHDPLGIGYNAAQATIAVGSGKLFGRGLGQGTQSHLRFLPERHTDFIFASTVEELGFIGGLIILGAYLTLCSNLIKLSHSSATEAGSLIILGTVGMLLTQIFINIGMNMSLVPITGITLPFVSAGGSSIIGISVALGLCLSVARHGEIRQPVLEIR